MEREDRTSGTTSPDRLVRELRRKNSRTLLMDGLYLFMTAFFAFLATRGVWPAAIAALPLVGLLYFGWKSSRAFFAAQAVAALAAAAFSVSGVAVL